MAACADEATERAERMPAWASRMATKVGRESEARSVSRKCGRRRRKAAKASSEDARKAAGAVVAAEVKP